MFITIPAEFDLYVRCAGAVLTTALAMYDNKVPLWKLTHKKDYKYLISHWWGYNGPTSHFVRWVDDNLWNASKEKLLSEFDYYSTELRTCEKFRNAPAEVQTEAIRSIAKVYQDALSEIVQREANWERMARKAKMDAELARQQKEKRR